MNDVMTTTQPEETQKLPPLSDNVLRRHLLCWHPLSQTALFIQEILELRAENAKLREAVRLGVRLTVDPTITE